MSSLKGYIAKKNNNNKSHYFISTDIVSAVKIAKDIFGEINDVVEIDLDKIDWDYISIYQNLSEDFIRKFKNKVDWDYISTFQNLSEDFIIKFKDKINWDYISMNQKLSEDFIRKFKNMIDWDSISMNQKLSEDFIRKFKNMIDWDNISKYQKLSENFIIEFKNRVNWEYISKHQKLSEDFRNKFNIKKPENSLMYSTSEEKLKLLPEEYKYDGEWIYAYKGIRSDRYSKFNFQYQYLKGYVYESHADFNMNTENSFGLSVWTEEKAGKYCDELIIEVRFKPEDIAAIVHGGNKIRVTKLEVLT